MHIILWKYRVPAAHQPAFIFHYHEHGSWAQLFRKDPNYRGTEFLRGVNADEFLTIDRWNSEADFIHFKQRYAQAYATLDAQCDSLTSEEIHLGSFTG